MDSESRVTFAVIGTSNFAVKMIAAIGRTANCAVGAVVSRDPQKVVVANGVPMQCRVWEDVVRDPKIDAVYVVTPNDTHAPITMDAARHRKHVLCEKPMAKTTDECARMIAVCAAAEVLLMPGYMLRFHRQYAHLKEVVQRRVFGDIRSILLNCSFRYPPNGNWRQTQPDEGPLWDLASHAVDLTRFLLGKKLTVVHCAEKRAVHGYLAPDTADLELKSENGCAISVHVSFAEEKRSEIAVNCDRGTVIGEDAISQDGPSPFMDSWNGRLILKPDDQYANMFSYFAECIRNNKNPEIVTGEDGLAATAILEEARRASKWK